jgi:glycosyltransferase involved in cell wall biosynthesis
MIFIGRLIDGKGIETVMDALAQLSRKGRAVRLAVVGHGPLRLQLERLAHDLGINSQVRFYGLLPSAKLVSCLRASRVLVLCSDSYPEGFGIVIAEALACGKPVIVSDQPALMETAGQAGLVVPQKNSGYLAEAIEKILGDPVLYQRLAEQARGQAQLYALERVGCQYVRFLNSVLSGRSKALQTMIRAR